MADNFLGGHRRIVEELSSRLRALQRGDLTVPRVVLLKAPSGEGKSRIIRELFSRLRVASSAPQYWSMLDDGARSGTEDPIVSRQQVAPQHEAVAPPEGALPGFGWWAVDCERLAASATLSVAAMLRAQWEAHGPSVVRAWNNAAGLSEAPLVMPEAQQVDGIALGRTLRSLSHPRLPGLIVLEDLQFMTADLAALVEEASVAAPDQPMLIIGTVRPEAPHSPEFEAWLARAGDRVETIDVPQLAAADLITLLREHAPHTDDATAMRAVARLGNPLYLKLWLTSAAMTRHIDAHSGAIVHAVLPERARDVLRARWEELPDAVRAVLACAVVANPLTADRLAHFAPTILADVCTEFLGENFSRDQILEALEVSAAETGWCSVESGVQFFKDSLLAETVREAAVAELHRVRADGGAASAVLADGAGTVLPANTHLGTGRPALRALTRKRIERWIDETHDEYTLPETEEAALLARWYVALAERPIPGPPGSRKVDTRPTGALAAAQWRIACDAAARSDHADAVVQGRYALATLKRVLGDDHPAEYLREQRDQAGKHVAPEWAMQLVIAEWLGDQSHPAESIDALRTLLADMERHAGTRHLATLMVRRSLAGQLSDAGIADEAVGQFRTVIADFTAVVGPKAQEVLDARAGLAEAFGVSGQYDAAVNELRSLIPLFLKVYGEAHPDTFLVRGALAAFLSQSGQPHAAVEQARMLLEDQELALGPDDSQALTTRNNLAVMLLDSGDLAAAVEQFEKLAAERAELLGATNPDTLDTRMNLAMALLELGRAQDAVREFRDTLAVMQQTMAPGNPSVLRGRGQLAEALGKAGDPVAAVVALRELERDMARAPGAGSADIAMIAEAARFWERGGPR